jgi:hypothetical protein
MHSRPPSQSQITDEIEKHDEFENDDDDTVSLFTMMFRFLRSRSLQRALLAPASTAVPSSAAYTSSTPLPLRVVIESRTPSSSSRHFHSTPFVSFPVRRRRRTAAPIATRDDYDSDDEEDGDATGQSGVGLSHDAVVDPILFQEGADALLQKIQIALAPMQRANDIFFVTRGTEEDLGDFLMIDIGPVHGQYNLQIDLEQKCLVFQSPISGQRTYQLSESKGEWFNEVDGHAFEGLLVRDLIRQVNGVPNL